MFGLSPPVEVALGVISVAMFVGTLVAVPVFLVRVSDDHFARPHPPRPLVVRVLRAVLGLGLIGLGVLMLVLPGQGLLTILIGLGILDLPIKHRITRRILCNPKVRHAIDSLRHRAGKGSLIVPGSSESNPSTATPA